jgi:hypothetical protein
MAITIQSTYSTSFAAGYAGMVANGEESNRISRTVEDSAGIAFGKAAFRGSGDHGVTATRQPAPSWASRSPTRRRRPGRRHGRCLPAVRDAALLNEGCIYVTVGANVADGDQAYVTPAGVWTNTSNSSANPQVPGEIRRNRELRRHLPSARHPLVRGSENARSHLPDAQQAAGFVTPALYRTHATVFETKYPAFDYAGLVPVNTDGDMWDIGTLVYSGDIAGAAPISGGQGLRHPERLGQLHPGHERLPPGRRRLRAGLQEVNRASRMNVGLDGRKASAARMVAEKFIYDRVISGSTEKNTTGLINNASVPTANATTGGWGSATPAQMLADVNAGARRCHHQQRRDGDAERAAAADLALPDGEQHAAVQLRQRLVLTFLQENNSYTAITGQPLDIRPSRELETAGASSSTKRMIAYEKSPDKWSSSSRPVRVPGAVRDLVHVLARRRHHECRPARDLSAQGGLVPRRHLRGAAMKLTNNAPGARGVNLKDGTTLGRAGRDVTLVLGDGSEEPLRSPRYIVPVEEHVTRADA